MVSHSGHKRKETARMLVRNVHVGWPLAVFVRGSCVIHVTSAW